MLPAIMCKIRRRASGVAHATWGVTKALGAESIGLFAAGGSCDSTSQQYAPRRPSARAAAIAFSSTSFPLPY